MWYDLDMNGSNEEKIVVQFEINPARRADVGPILATLALPNSIEIIGDISEATTKFVDGISEPMKYNPELVSTIWDYKTGSILPIITHDMFVDFSVGHELANKRTAELLFRALYRDARKLGSDRLFAYMHKDSFTQRVTLRADRVAELNQRYKEGRMGIIGVGLKLQKLLSDIESLMYINDQKTAMNPRQ